MISPVLSVLFALLFVDVAAGIFVVFAFCVSKRSSALQGILLGDASPDVLAVFSASFTVLDFDGSSVVLMLLLSIFLFFVTRKDLV